MATLQNTTIRTTSGTDNYDINLKAATDSTGLQFDKAGYFSATALTSGTSVSWNAGSNQSAVLVLGHNATIANATNHAWWCLYIEGNPEHKSKNIIVGNWLQMAR